MKIIILLLTLSLSLQAQSDLDLQSEKSIDRRLSATVMCPDPIEDILCLPWFRDSIANIDCFFPPCGARVFSFALDSISGVEYIYVDINVEAASDFGFGKVYTCDGALAGTSSTTIAGLAFEPDIFDNYISEEITFFLLGEDSCSDLPAFTNLPFDMTISCDEGLVPPAIDLVYTNNGVDSCTLNQPVRPIVTGFFDVCGTTIRYNWDATDSCGNVLSHEQVITVLPANPPSFVNPPRDLTITCDESLVPDPINLVASNNGVGSCLDAFIVTPSIVGNFSICGGEIIYTWEYTDKCGVIVEHVQVITILPVEESVFLELPQDLTITCDPNLLPAPQTLTYANTGTGNCYIEGTVMPLVSGSFACGNTISYTWSFTDNCGQIFTQVQSIFIEESSCALDARVSEIACNDEGTSDLTTDDTYSLTLLANGASGSSTGYTLSTGQQGTYGVPLTLTDILISAGELTLVMTDNADPSCVNILLVMPPAPCSFSANQDNDNDGSPATEDCDDNDSNVYPGALELCNNIDDNCDGMVDEGFTVTRYYFDGDGDGYGISTPSIVSCSLPTGFALSSDDCDDTNPSVNPGQTEGPYNGLDDDCNPATLDDDLDQDGYNIDQDCDDTNPNIYPGAVEIPNNNIDEDCDGQDATSGIHQIADTVVNIFPNPASDQINIAVVATLDYQINIYNLAGQLVITERNPTMLSVAAVPIGTYLLEMRDLDTGLRIVDRIVISP